MKVNTMNARVVVSSSENVLRDLLEGQPPDLVHELARDLRIRQTLRWAGPEAFGAPFVVQLTAPDGGESVEATRDLVAAGKLRWDPDELTFVARLDDPAEYTIPGEDEDLLEVLDHPLVPEMVRDRLRQYQARTEADAEACQRVLTAVQARLKPTSPLRTPRGAFVLRREEQQPSHRLAAKETSYGGLTVTKFIHAADGQEVLRVNHRRGEDQCTIELLPPVLGEVEPSRIVLVVGGRPIKPVIPFDEYGYGRVQYSDVEDVLSGKCDDLCITVE
jgi:hypothetical protein